MSSNLDFVNEIVTGRIPLEQHNLIRLKAAKLGLLDLCIKYESEDQSFKMFAQFYVGHEKVDIPVISARGAQRTFKNLHRCLDWGKQHRFRQVIMNFEFSEYKIIK
jgi:hypothetical protein